MSRYSSNDILEVGRLTSGTSAQFIGYNTRTGRKGIYKENGCVLGIDNDDIREKLSSDILSSLGVAAANIDLVRDEETGKNTYFSNYIIGDNEELVAPDMMGCESESKNPIENMCNRYVQGVRKLTNDEKFIEASRKNFYQYTYMCCMLDCYDIKPDNLPLVYNRETNMLSMAPYFDFGTAFCPEHKSAPIYEMSTDEMLESLYKNNYEDIKDIAHKVNTELTPKRISELLGSDYVTETLGQDEIDKIRTRFISQVEKSREMELSREQVNTKQPKGIGVFLRNIKDRISLLFNRGKDVKMLGEQTNTNYEDKEKLAKLGFKSVAEMNEHDDDAKEASKMLTHLQENTYPPQAPEVVAYDNSYQQHNIDGQDITLEQ